MDKVAKMEKWSESTVAALCSVYDETKDVDTVVARLAEMNIHKTRKAVIGKLVSLKAYQKPVVAPKAAKDNGPSKKELLAALANKGFSNVDGLTNAQKSAIAEVLKFFEPENSLLEWFEKNPSDNS